MGDLVIKPEAGGSIKLQNNAGTNALVSYVLYKLHFNFYK